MIGRLEIAGVHVKVDEDLEKYARKKIGQLDRFAPRLARESLHAEIKLKEAKAKDKKSCTCEVVLHLPHETLITSESTINMYAAIDIVETKLIQQLKKYKDLHNNPKLYRRIVTRLNKS
jgi:ribosomal subunit interface protein